MSELRKIVQKLGQALSAGGPPSRALSRISTASSSPSRTCIDYGFFIQTVPCTILAPALDKSLELSQENRGAMYPDTGESGETYDVELGTERVLARGVFDRDRITDAVR